MLDYMFPRGLLNVINQRAVYAHFTESWFRKVYFTGNAQFDKNMKTNVEELQIFPKITNKFAF